MAQKAADSRWITIRENYDHYWPSRAVTAFPPGEYRVKNEVADGAIAKGKAVEGRLDGSEKTPPKPRRARKAAPKPRKTAAAKSVKPAGDAGPTTTDKRSDAKLAGTGVPADDRAAVRGAVDSAAE